MSTKEQKEVDDFKKTVNKLVDSTANLHSYSRHLNKLSIGFTKKEKQIVIGFVNVEFLKINNIEWNFKGLEVEILDNCRYKIYDRDRFEVICRLFGVFEEVLNVRSSD
jgi:hypothetical protein